ncbi:unnamed protein product, partial [Prorocentrum cordatum]
VDVQRVPLRAGRTETLGERQAEVELPTLATKEDDRKLLGPRLVQALPENSVHRKLALRLPRVEGEPDAIVGEKGPENLGKQASSDAVDKVICPDMDVMDLIPDELRGIIFLVNANLDPSERATMVAALDDWKSDTAIDKVKYAWRAQVNYQEDDDEDDQLVYYEEDEFEQTEEAEAHYEEETANEEIETLEACAEDAEIYAQDAKRTFAEAKKMLAATTKKRSGYFPEVGIGQIPGKNIKDQRATAAAKSALRPPRPPGPQGGERPPMQQSTARRPHKGKGKGKSVKCLICQGPHQAADCPRRGNTGTDGNNMQMATQCFVDAVDAEQNNYSNEGDVQEAGQAGWAHEEMVGYTITDTGTSKSMIGMDLALANQETIVTETGLDQVEVDYTKKTNFTYAGGEKGQSIGRFGFEHPIALAEDKSKLWFDLVEKKSPILLGLDYLEK